MTALVDRIYTRFLDVVRADFHELWNSLNPTKRRAVVQYIAETNQADESMSDDDVIELLNRATAMDAALRVAQALECVDDLALRERIVSELATPGEGEGLNVKDPTALREKAAQLRVAAQRQVDRAERDAKELEVEAAEEEQAEARRTAAAQFRAQAKQAAEELAALRAQHSELEAQLEAVGQKRSELEAARTAANQRAATLQDQVGRLVRGGADVGLVAEKRAQADSLLAIGRDYEVALEPLVAQADALQRQFDGLKYPVEHAEAEMYRFEELAEDPYGEQARARFEAARQQREAEHERWFRRRQTAFDVERETLKQIPGPWPGT